MEKSKVEKYLLELEGIMIKSIHKVSSCITWLYDIRRIQVGMMYVQNVVVRGGHWILQLHLHLQGWRSDGEISPGARGIYDQEYPQGIKASVYYMSLQYKYMLIYMYNIIMKHALNFLPHQLSEIANQYFIYAKKGIWFPIM